MATESEVEAVLVMLQAAFPAYKPANPGVMADLYIRKLARFHSEALKTAADQLIDKGRFFPSISEFVKLAETAQEFNNRKYEELSARRQALQNQVYLEGIFEPAEWEKLASEMIRCGRQCAAEALREKAARIGLEFAPAVQ